MTALQWPPDTRESQKEHAARHVHSIELAIGLCRSTRTAVQAGGNVGLWPRRMAQTFTRVLTFEPEPISRACLIANVAASPHVEVRSEALGAAVGACSIVRKSLGSHRVIDGDACPVIALDDLGLTDVDLLQLDIEGYELEALRGAVATIARCRPIVQVELRGFTEKYGATDAQVFALLTGLGYREHAKVPGSDVVFRYGA